MTFQDLRLGFLKRFYFRKFEKMETLGDPLKVEHFGAIKNQEPRMQNAPFYSTSTVLFVTRIKFSAPDYKMTFQDLRLGFLKRPYF